MSTYSNVNEIVNIESSVTTISTHARIDYIMRFSKHAVLVLTRENENNSSVANQFIDKLPDNHNAAFLTISSKLNDIQIRCRLVEQLYSDVLFDPEESLAVTILKLSKDKKQPISLVLENAEHLSIKLLDELCQLTALANKVDRVANVLLLGNEATGKLIAKNRAVFQNKLSMLQAESGQLIAMDSAYFIDKPVSIFRKYWPFLAITLAALIIITIVFIMFLSNSDDVSEVTLAQNEINNVPTVFVENVEVHSIDEKIDTIKKIKNAEAVNENIATPEDIVQLLTIAPEVIDLSIESKEMPKAIVKKVISESDIKPMKKIVTVNTPTVISPTVTSPTVISQVIVPPIIVSEVIELNHQDSRVILHAGFSSDEKYYLEINKGYVAQVGGFSSEDSYQKFIKKFPDNDFYHYYRLYNKTKLIVVTTRVYPLETDARAAISFLPQTIKSAGVWVKTIETINREINAFQSSQ